MKETELKIDGKIARGVEVNLPGAPLVLAYGENGFVMCGYLDIQTAEKVNAPAAVVRGVKTVEDLLKAQVVAITKAAEGRGVKLGMTGKEALGHLL